MAIGVDTVGEFLKLDTNRVCSINGIGAGTQRTLEYVRQRLSAAFDKVGTDCQYLEVNIDGNWSYISKQLSGRTKHGLKSLSINTIDEFLGLTPERFLSIPSMGKASCEEVSRMQKKLTYSEASSPDYSEAKPLDSDVESALLTRVKELLITREHLIDDLEIRSFSELCKLKYEDFIKLECVGQAAWQKLQSSISKAKLLIPNYTKNEENITIYDFPLFNGETDVWIRNIPQRFSPDALVSQINLSARTKPLIKALSIRTVSELLLLSSEKLLKHKNFGQKSLRHLRESLLEYVSYQNNELSTEFDTKQSFQDFLRYLCALSEHTAEHTDIFVLRICGNSNRPETFDAIGEKYGITKEWVRQIVKTVITKIGDNFRSRVGLENFNKTVIEALCDLSGIADADEVGVETSKKLNWKLPISGKSLIEFYDCMSCLSEERILIKKRIFSCEHKCRECDVISKHLLDILSSESSGSIVFENLISQQLCEFVEECGFNTNMKFSKAFLRELCGKNSLRYDKLKVYKNKTRNIIHRRSSKEKIVILVFDR